MVTPFDEKLVEIISSVYAGGAEAQGMEISRVLWGFEEGITNLSSLLHVAVGVDVLHELLWECVDIIVLKCISLVCI